MIRLGGGVVNPATGEVVEMETWEQGNFGNLDARVILKEGGSMGDVYAAHVLATDSNGNIKVDPQTGAISMMAKDVKLGSILPDFNMGWSNNFDYKGINLGVTFSARIGGIALSSTESFLDQYGVSERSGRARDNAACRSTTARSMPRPTIRESPATAPTTPTVRRTSVCRSSRWDIRFPQSGSATRCG